MVKWNRPVVLGVALSGGMLLVGAGWRAHLSPAPLRPAHSLAYWAAVTAALVAGGCLGRVLRLARRRADDDRTGWSPLWIAVTGGGCLTGVLAVVEVALEAWAVPGAGPVSFARNGFAAATAPFAVTALGVAAARALHPERTADDLWRDGADVHAARPDRDLWAPPHRQPGGVGICASGGGIRSACVTLGALQSLQAAGVLRRARYLVGVSGGGYAVGAYQLALTAPSTATPDDVLRAGSVEEDHLRRHSRYLADSASQWCQACGRLLFGLAANLTLLALTVLVAGVLVRLYYEVTPGYPLDAAGIRRPQFGPDVRWALAGPLAVALAFLAVAAGWCCWRGEVPRPCVLVIQACTLAAAMLAGLGIALPHLLWLGALLTDALHLRAQDKERNGLGTLLVTYLAAVVAIAWRGRSTLSGLRARVTGAPRALHGLLGGLLQRLVVLAALGVVAAGYLVLLTATVQHSDEWRWWRMPVVVVALGFACGTVDQTWLGLHTFYRERLASAFAVRRVDDRARAYDYDGETTRLSTHGAKHPDFPQVIFAAAAHISGDSVAPPGRRVVSYTMSHDWIGGPQVGWLSTVTVDGTGPRPANGRRPRFGLVSRDLTVQAAVTVSGAAFASAMGSQASAYQTLFAVSNARLGTWLPNPAHVAARLTRADWTAAGIPRLRRLPYLLREIFGRYSATDPLLFVTDGGHYENLGLVELLRHRCELIYCVDASGDPPPLADALGTAIALAAEELNVTVRLTRPFDLVPGSGEPLGPQEPLSALNGRLSAGCVVTGEISYPPCGDLPASTGRLVVAKATLTADMPYEVLTHAQKNPVFPYDSTADQWFDVCRFDAYQALGRHLGREAAARTAE